MDGTAPVLLGNGGGHGLSPDGQWAITEDGQPGAGLLVIPTGPGEAKRLPRGGVETYHGASFFPDGRRILVLASEAGRPQRLFTQDLDGGLPRAVSPEGYRVAAPGSPVSPEGARIAAFPDDARHDPVFVSVEDGTVRSIDGLGPGDVPLAWTTDGKSLLVREPPAGSAWRVVQFNVETRKRTLWKELRLAEPSGASVVYNPVIARDGEVTFYTSSAISRTSTSSKGSAEGPEQDRSAHLIPSARQGSSRR
jgi:Tol biopolymer transport system component